MNKFIITRICIVVVFAACHKKDVGHHALRNFTQVNLVANKSEYNPRTIDTTLINAFGMAWSPTGIAWVNSVGGHVSELYNADGSISRPSVNIPSPTDTVGGLPTGIVFSGGKGFQLPNGPSLFLFSGFDGVISGWNGASGLTAKKLRNPAQASFTGLALATDNGKNLVYAANFGANKIDVWDTTFSRVNMSFRDPNIPEGFSPYNIQAVGDLLYVVYAQIGTNGLPVTGKGKGFVSVFNANGSFVRRFASQGTLNTPWGLTLAERGFLQNDDLTGSENNKDGGEDNETNMHDNNDQVILVGNFGDGRINVFTLNGRFLGQLQSKNKPIEIEGLWALTFPPASAAIDPDRLYFTAGPKQETDGLFGYLIKE